VIVSDNSLHITFPSTEHQTTTNQKLMNNTLHTNGPWAIHTCNENGPSLDSFYLSTTAQTWDGNEEERIICRFPTGTGQFFDMGRENLANARLISAAPDLLSTLEKLLACASKLDQSATHEGLQNCEAIAQARRVLCKAKGEA
jgi:hypothetical protein